MDNYSNTVNWFFGKAREFFGPEPGALVPLNILAAFFAHEHSDASMRILHGYTSIGLVIGIGLAIIVLLGIYIKLLDIYK